MPSVKLAGALPDADSDDNGLVAIADELVKHPKGSHLVIGWVTNQRTTVEHQKGGAPSIPTAMFTAIEVVDNPRDLELAQKLLDRARAMRTGAEPLPLDWASEHARLA